MQKKICLVQKIPYKYTTKAGTYEKTSLTKSNNSKVCEIKQLQKDVFSLKVETNQT